MVGFAIHANVEQSKRWMPLPFALGFLAILLPVSHPVLMWLSRDASKLDRRSIFLLLWSLSMLSMAFLVVTATYLSSDVLKGLMSLRWTSWFKQARRWPIAYLESRYNCCGFDSGDDRHMRPGYGAADRICDRRGCGDAWVQEGSAVLSIYCTIASVTFALHVGSSSSMIRC